MDRLKLEVIYVCVIFALLLWTTCSEDVSECSMITCFNNGTMVTKNRSCVCQCQANFSGLLCEYELMPSAWPSGPYALMMPSTGCPESEAHGWGCGYINFTAVNRVEVWEEFENDSIVDIRQVSAHHDTMIYRLFLNFSLQLNFCFKHAHASPSNTTEWPLAPINVFGVEDGCPTGFIEEALEIFLPNTSSWRSDGYLPYFSILSTENGTKIVTKNCRYEEWKEFPGQRQTDPFILFQGLNRNCSTNLLRFTSTSYTISICDANPNSTDITHCPKMHFCAYYPVPEFSDEEEAISRWPNIPFAMLYPTTGCPGYADWKFRFIRFKTFTHVTQYYNGYSRTDNETFYMYFCVKKKLEQVKEILSWPRGEYSILRVKDECPDGFTSESISVPLPPITNWYGYDGLPQFEVQLNKSEIVFEACRHKRGHNYLVPFPSYDTFWSLQMSGTLCGTPPKDGLQSSQKNVSIVETSDELGCPEDEFMCDYRKCIDRIFVCDGESDCSDGSDENLANCATRCDFPELNCDKKLCIPRIWFCDRFQHCNDGQDEMESVCLGNGIMEGRCLDREIACDGKCLPVSWVCDGTKDCSDGSDEEMDNCELKCEKDEFSCDYGRCIARQSVCDNFYECFDETDEKDCNVECSTDEFNCGTKWLQTNRHCIKRSKVCDGYPDCPDHEDEDVDFCSSEMKPFCESKLGLTDGYINDNQMSASSWRDPHKPEMARPFHRGWCPAMNDRNPFLQIDLLFVSLIKGLILFNDVIVTWKENNLHNVPKLELLGCRSFHLSYGIFQDSFKQYDDKPFEVDGSQNIEIPQQFMFLRPYLARFVRIHPLSPIYDGQLCLRLELIGCATINGSQTHAIIQPGKANEVNLKVRNYRRITSKSFPLEYPSNTVYIWNVTTDGNGYLRFTFEVIDLHSISIIPSVECPEDKVILSKDIDPITSIHNGLFPTFPTTKRRAFITFSTCKRMYNYNERRKGFALIIKKEDAPTVGIDEVFANMDEGQLLSYSFLGLVTIPQIQRWSLQSSMHGGPYILSIQYFNFPANTGNVLSVKSGSSEYVNYNNEKKPMDNVEGWNIQIIAYVDEKVLLPFPNGFSAIFRIDIAPKYYDQFLEFDETTTHSTNRFVQDEHKVCLKIFRKCYTLLHAYENLGWSTQYRRCHSFGHSLINIHSRKEQRFLQSWLLYKLRDFRFHGRGKDFMLKEPTDPSFYIHIGLLRYTDDTGLHEIWTDGSKVSFTNWDKDRSEDPEPYRCTGFRISRTLEDTKWIAYDCFGRSQLWQYTFVLACETPFETSGQELVFGMAENVDSAKTERHILSAVLFRCSSSKEMVSQLVVCDGIPDCMDWSDESKCVSKSFDLHELKNSQECSGRFTCSNGECLPFAKVCNYVSDCFDGSDELCKYPDCDRSEFKCSNGQCIAAYLRCDILEDCLDGSDELQCGICNSSVAFACDDLTCIHKSFVCNNIQDCSNGEDETNCTLMFSTCYDYWKRGYDNDLSIHIPDSYWVVSCLFLKNVYPECLIQTEGSTCATEFGVAKCRFQTSGAIVTVSTFFDIGYKRESATTGQRLLRNVFDIKALEHGDQCSYVISETCDMSMADLEEYYRFVYSANFTLCYSRWYNVSFGRLKNDTNFAQIMTREGIEIYHVSWPTSFPLASLYHKKDYGPFGVVSILPIECKKEYRVPIDEIRCGDGTIVPASLRCLYGLNSAGVIDGCTNYKHLEDCETFSCPPNYAKCRSSFCVADRFICDGERNCPGGEDENGCECKQRSSTVAFIYDRNMDRNRKSFVFKFARQFYSENAKSVAIPYSLKISDTSKTIYYTHTTQDINPYNEAFQDFEYVYGPSIIQTSIATTLHFITNTTIVVFNIEHEQSSSHHLSGITNISFVNHLYNLRVDPNIRQRAIVKNSSKETEVIFKSWETIGNVKQNLFHGICLERTTTNCVGRYRCSSSRICIPLDQICDGEKQCPFRDDEALCDFHCPEKCFCKMYVVDCRDRNFTDFDLQIIVSTIRMLDISQNILFRDNVFSLSKPFPFLLELNASRCNLRTITIKTFNKAQSLIHLDLSFNQISIIHADTFSGLVNLKSIDFNGNYLLERIEPRAFEMLSMLSSLSITKTRLFEIESNTFSGLVLKTLDIANNQIHNLHGRAFNNLSVEEISFEGNDVSSYDVQIFTGIRTVKTIRAPAFKFCCYKPSFVDEKDCFPPTDEFSSCDDLMRNSILQTLIWLMGAMALVGNISVLIYRLVYDRSMTKNGYGMFVTHLAASDFLMGVYMITIAIADLTFRKRYIEVDDFWRNSIWCQIAGILATVSSETSILLIILITVDRFMVTKFPFGQRKFSKLSIWLAVLSSWAISWTLAVVPLLADSYFEGAFYSQSGVCLALPLSRNRRPGWLYSFLIHIALNLVAFILIAIGQIAIYLEIKKSSKRMKHVRSQRRNDIRIAKNLLLVVATDFLCWFPIGIMAILAYEGYAIPRDIHAWTAVVILPVNSALNPLLYTLPALLRQKAEETKMNERNVQTKDAKDRNRSLIRHTLCTPREAAIIALAITRKVLKLHLRDLVYGDNILVETCDGKVYRPLPKRGKDPIHDKQNDIRNLGNLFEKILKMTNTVKSVSNDY